MSHAPPTHTRRRCSSSRGRTRRVGVWPWGHVPLNLPVWRNNPDTITKRKMAAPVLVTPRFALAIANARDAGSRAGGLRSLCLDARVPTVRPGGRIGRARTMPRARLNIFVPARGMREWRVLRRRRACTRRHTGASCRRRHSAECHGRRVARFAAL